MESSTCTHQTIAEGQCIMAIVEPCSSSLTMGPLPPIQVVTTYSPPVTILSAVEAASVLECLRSSTSITPPITPETAPPVESTQSLSAGMTTTRDSIAALSRAKAHTKNLRFLILVRILLNDLDRTGEHAMKNQLKVLVQECIRRRRNKEAGFSPLERAAETAIKAVVGTNRWNRAHQELSDMMLQRWHSLLRKL